MKIASSGSLRSRSARALVAALAVGAGLGSAGCEPGVATPIPEPPTLDLGRVGPPTTVVVAQPENGTHLYGSPGTAPSSAIVRVTNLDGTDPPSTVNVQADGSFDVTINVTNGQELRFDWLRGTERGAPQDAHFIVGPPYHLEPSERFECLRLSPGFVVDFGQTTTQTLLIANECTSSVSLATPRARLGLPDFTRPSALPLELMPGAQASLELAFERTDPAAREDTFFFDVLRDGTTIRYPITLLAPASP